MSKIINIAFVILIVFTLFFSGYNAKQDITDFAYVVAIGIDVGQSNDLKISFQSAIPSQKSSEGSSSDKDTVIDTIESPSIESGLSLANGYVSKKLNLSHCKAIVISEEVARLGISDIIYTLINDVELRPDCNVIVSRSTAVDFLSNSKSQIENITAKYYEVVATSSKYTGFTENVKISDVFDRMSDTYGEAYAILGSSSSSSTSASSDAATGSSPGSTATASQNASASDSGGRTVSRRS